MTDITPTDIVNKEFHRRLRGYADNEVDEFLQLTSDSLFRALEEQQRLRAHIDELEQRIQQYQQTEALIKNALVLAERTADEVRQSARAEADLIRREAEAKVREERTLVEELRQLRFCMLAELRALLNAQLSLIEHQEARLAGGQAAPTGEGG